MAFSSSIYKLSICRVFLFRLDTTQWLIDGRPIELDRCERGCLRPMKQMYQISFLSIPFVLGFLVLIHTKDTHLRVMTVASLPSCQYSFAQINHPTATLARSHHFDSSLNKTNSKTCLKLNSLFFGSLGDSLSLSLSLSSPSKDLQLIGQ